MPGKRGGGTFVPFPILAPGGPRPDLSRRQRQNVANANIARNRQNLTAYHRSRPPVNLYRQVAAAVDRAATAWYSWTTIGTTRV